MPIRMTDDQPDQPDPYKQDDGGGNGRGGSSGGGGLFALLPLLLGLFRGKGILLLIVLAVGGYFLFGRAGGCAGGGLLKQVSQLATGGILDPKEFQKANIYESLDDDDNKNPLPEAVNLQRYAPSCGKSGTAGQLRGMEQRLWSKNHSGSSKDWEGA